MNKAIDVVLTTYGEPTRNSFIEHWKYSSRILWKLTRRVAPIPAFAVPFIGAYRGWLRTSTWQRSGYLSSLESITEKQRGALERKLHELSTTIRWRVHTAYEFRSPTLFEKLQEIHRRSSLCILLVPMYVARSDFTSGLSLASYARFQKLTKCAMPSAQFIVLSDHLEKLAAVMASFVEREMEQRGVDLSRCKKRGLLLGAHGTIVSPLRNIENTGHEDTAALSDLLVKRLSSYFERASIAWLNHRRGGEWTSPSIQQAAKEMIERGISDLVYFPFGFLADNEETELNSKRILKTVGITDYIHLPCVNDDDRFIKFLAEVILERFGS